jgi:Domain of unknown function (DUF5606)
MEYNKIIAVTGLPGLYELLSSKSDGAIVRSLDDKTTRFVSSRIHNFSHLESIEVYTVRDNVNLVDILKAMEAGAEKLPDEKDGAELKAYFTKVYPDLDFGRVYSSDLKKMVKWYSVLKANNIEIKLSEPEEEETESEEAAVEEASATPKKEAATKKKAAAESTATTEAPAKAAATKEKPAHTEKAAHTEKTVKAEKAVTKEKPAAEVEKPKAKKTEEKEKPAAKTEKAKKAEEDKAEKPGAEKRKGAAKKK